MITSSQLSLVAVLPALNEACLIGALVSALQAYAVVVVVDDGSSDGTGDIARIAGAHVLTHYANYGYESALETGLMWAAHNGYSYAVTLDADGQHNPIIINDFIQHLSNGSDIVIGVRDQMPRWSERLFAFVTWILWGIRDPLCGMKAYRLDLLRRVQFFRTYQSIGSEFCIRAARSGCSIKQVPIKVIDRDGLSRFGSGIYANVRILKAIFLSLILAHPFTKL